MLSIISALILGLVCGALARAIIPGDAFQNMSGPASWLTSMVLGVLGALLGFWFFTSVLGIGDADKFDWGSLLGALIGSIVVVAIASFVVNRSRGRTSV